LILIHCLRPYTDSRWWWTFLFVTLVVGPRLQHKHTGRRLLLPTGNSFHNPPYYYRIFHPPSSHLADAFTLLFLVVSSFFFLLLKKRLLLFFVLFFLFRLIPFFLFWSSINPLICSGRENLIDRSFWKTDEATPRIV
jgi:hypothetical protein